MEVLLGRPARCIRGQMLPYFRCLYSRCFTMNAPYLRSSQQVKIRRMFAISPQAACLLSNSTSAALFFTRAACSFLDLSLSNSQKRMVALMTVGRPTPIPNPTFVPLDRVF